MTSEAVREKEGTSNCCWKCITRLIRCLACCWESCCEYCKLIGEGGSIYSDTEELSRDFELEETEESGNIDDLTGTARDTPLEGAPDRAPPDWPKGETPRLIAATTTHQSSETDVIQSC